MENIKGIILDYGGTVDSRGTHWSEIIWDGYRSCGVPVDKTTFRRVYVETERELARHRHILPHHTFSDLMEIKMRIEFDMLVAGRHIPPAVADSCALPVARYCYRAAKDTIDSCRHALDAMYERLPMVLVSNFYGNIGAVLEDFNLGHYFRAVIESAVVGVRKPDPAIFRMGVDALGLTPRQVVVIGDSYGKDILPAQSIGCPTVWLKGKGWDDDEYSSIMHPNIIKSLDEALDVLF